jgi:glycine/D-amino acid oxidase-like deaminating enzyme
MSGAGLSRRALGAAVAGGWLTDALGAASTPIAGRIVGASHAAGHRLRDGAAALGRDDDVPLRADVVVVGSGVSGASAAWRLGRSGVSVVLLELEPFAGGTSGWGEDGAVPYPWGAHYLPVPDRGARATLRLLEELGVVTGWDAAGRPRLREEMLCHAPEERIFYDGRWHLGTLVPLDALDAPARAELARFAALERDLAAAEGGDGRPAFAVPSTESSRDPRFVALDRLSMDAWLTREGFGTAFLRWYVEYAMLDDFGAALSEVSAWAGLHYFAARKLVTDQLGGTRFLVWPEGNGWLVRRMLAGLGAERVHGALVHGVAPLAKGGVEVRWLELATGVGRRAVARGVVLATPAFVTARLVPSARPLLPARTSSPWLVANLHVRHPFDPDGAWDSVHYEGRGLGYVDASHQLLGARDETVLTYYRAYGGADVAAARSRMLRAGWTELASEVLADLAEAEPELVTATRRLDVMLWGHGMPRPRPGFLGERPFEAPVVLAPGVAWAHVDQSGLALFEEANLCGVRAAEALAPALGVDLGPSWA